MTKGEATRSRIIEEATRLASVRGLLAVSLADVADPAGLTKSGLFKHFDRKETMQQAVLENAFERFLGFVWAPLAAMAPGRARLEAMFARWIDWGRVECAHGGCPLNAMATELDDQPGPLRDYLRDRMLSWRRGLIPDFQALRSPPATEAQAWQAIFQMKGYVLSYGEAARLLGDSRARTHARAAFAALLDRMQGNV